MNKEKFEELLNEDFDKIRNTLINKTNEYANEDYLSCFKHSANIANITPIDSLKGFMLKHTTSVYDMLQEPTKYSMEKWDEKLFDHINYLILLRALLVEEKEGEDNGL